MSKFFLVSALMLLTPLILCAQHDEYAKHAEFLEERMKELSSLADIFNGVQSALLRDNDCWKKMEVDKLYNTSDQMYHVVSHAMNNILLNDLSLSKGMKDRTIFLKVIENEISAARVAAHASLKNVKQTISILNSKKEYGIVSHSEDLQHTLEQISEKLDSVHIR